MRAGAPKAIALLGFLVLLSGCSSSPEPVPEAVRAVHLQATMASTGELPVWYLVQVHQFQDNVSLQDQDGRVLWERQDSLAAGDQVTLSHDVAGTGSYWVEMRFEKTPEDLRSHASISAGFLFKLDPKACLPVVHASAWGKNSATGLGGGGDVEGCGPRPE